MTGFDSEKIMSGDKSLNEDWGGGSALNVQLCSDLSGHLITASITRPGDIPYTMGDWDGQRCPECGCETLSNSIGERWCSLVGCDFVA